MDVKTMSVDELNERKLAIATEVDAEGADLDALEEEARSINEELEERKNEELRKAELRSKVANGAGEVTQVITEPVQEEKRMFGIETKEYRDAFMANLVGNASEEQRAILADNSAYGDGLSLPVGLDTDIWDQIHTAHPILSDVAVIRAGMPIKVTRMTPAAVTKKMDSAASTEQTFTSAEVVLVGADYHTYVTLSYAEAKMSQGAMEKFLVKEIADAIGEALAKDVFARILTDATTAQKVTSTGDVLADLTSMLGKVTQGKPVIYAPAASYYTILADIAQGSPFNAAAALGCELKLDNAATGITAVDPSMFVLDVIQDTIIESERSAKDAQFIIGGYMRAEGCLRKVKAAAYIG